MRSWVFFLTSAKDMLLSCGDARQNLLRVGIGGLRCSPYLGTAALLSHLSLPLATVLSGVVDDNES
jgi:hypothetical protein